ncbi:MAG: pyrroline-5-carboxylate reductase [Pirellulaceae bacterium]
MKARTIGFIGAGQMAGALAHGFLQGGKLSADRVFATDPSSTATERFQAKIPGCQFAVDNRALLESAEVIFLAVKPQYIEAVSKEIAPVAGDRLIVSILAGVSLEKLQRFLGTERIIRVMPNTPCLVGQSAAAYCVGNGATAEDADLVESLLSTVGKVWRVEENLMDGVTGLSGSGPAFIYLLIEAMSDAGVQTGLPRAISTQLAAQTVKGAAEMVLATGLHPGQLKDQVTSPAGTTIRGLHVLEQRGVRGSMIDAIIAAAQRSRELGQ